MKNPITDKEGSRKEGSRRVLRGGFWNNFPNRMWVLYRGDKYDPTSRYGIIGFRIVRNKQ